MDINKIGLYASDILKIRQAEVEIIKGDASTRDYYRVFSHHASLVFCYDPNLVNKQECDFVDIALYLKENGFLVPDIISVDYKEGLIIQKDLGDLSLFTKMNMEPSSGEDLYKEAIEIIVKLASLKSDPLKRWHKRKFDKPKLDFEFKIFEDYFLKKYCSGLKLSLSKENLFKELELVKDQFSKLEYNFCHRDFHSKNLIISDSRLWVIDFQDAMVGPYNYDLSSLIEDCYLELGDDFKNELKGYYRSLVKIDKSKFDRDYAITTIQRNLKILGTFVFLAETKNKNTYLESIPAVVSRIQKATSGFDDFKVISDFANQLLNEVSP